MTLIQMQRMIQLFILLSTPPPRHHHPTHTHKVWNHREYLLGFFTSQNVNEAAESSYDEQQEVTANL